MTFAALLGQAMGEANLTRAELARRVGVKRAVVGKWISGVADGSSRRAALPGVGIVRRILDAVRRDEDHFDQMMAAYLRERGL